MHDQRAVPRRRISTPERIRFIYKAALSSKASIKANAASLKKFYAFMAERGLVKPEELDALKQQIKEELPDWLDTLERWRNPESDPPDGWPF
jgi:site-specific recombinase XerD